ncbi:endoplasmic reticulum metallopeptidase 1 isoform X2 [Microcaecilia unicolor]|uniref:Endoplasmic reticulum metallopeptidase 1 n=1 Tax=Microcaecilia unicolor TaxID=1415580 RepID=A0A6P7XG65_9AMPH|nr:endoplasmic reticulum metallopeptidase 1 isoform X2 [Microcaecilia unicolor]
MESGAAVRRFRTGSEWASSGARTERREEEKAEKRRLPRGATGSPVPRVLLREALALPLLLLFLLGLHALVHLSLRQLLFPGALSASTFNAVAARVYLEHVTGIGPRLVGSPANEVLTVNYLLEQIEQIKAASSKVHRLSVDVQRPTGTFSLDFLGGFASYYDNITNIAVKLEPRGGAQHAVLANCHFDSVANTPGPENPWLVQAYVSAAVHPFASVTAQEVFQSGIIPSETDFRIYRDFGNIPGIDLAFIENGYIYHTKYDTPDRILTDSIQRAGDNILCVLKYLATSDKLANPSEYRHGNTVFFDIFGLFVIAYPAHVGTVMNYIVATVTILYLGKKAAQSKYGGISYMKDLLFGIGIVLLSWFTTLCMVLIIAVFVSLTGYSLSWYTHFYVSICLYGAAAVTKIILVHTLAKRWFFMNMNAHYLGELFFDVSLIVWCFGLIIFIQKGLCSAYFMSIWVLFSLLTKLGTHREFTQKGATVRFVLINLLGMFVPYLHTLYLEWAVFEMFPPILGRSGSEIPPDVVLASIIVGCTMVLSTSFVHFVYLTKSMKKTLLMLTSLSAVTLILVCSGAFFPYSSDSANPKPKRIFLQHTTRTFHDLDGNVVKRDSGIWINSFDYTGISHITPHVPEINDTVQAECEDVPFCGFPWFLPAQFFIRKNWYLPAPEALPSKPTHFRLISKEQMPWDSTRLTFEITGPSHMSLYMRAHEGVLLSSWSLGDGVPVAGFREDYFVFYSHGLQAPPWQFWIELKVNKEDLTGIIAVAVASHYLFGKDQYSPQLEALEQKLPEWIFPSSWVCTYDLFVF